MKVYFHDLKGQHHFFQVHNFNQIKTEYSKKDFYQSRRLFRNAIFLHMINEDECFINEELKEIITHSSKIKYSCSYSSFNVAVALSDYKIGIDIEVCGKIRRKYLKLFSSEDEISVVRSTSYELTEQKATTLLWCCKESLGKLFDIGLSRGLNAFEFHILSDGNCYINKNFSDNNQKSDVHIYYDFFDNLCLAISTFHLLERSNLC